MAEEQCNHWNTRTNAGVELNPLRCTREQGHVGLHGTTGGWTRWSEDLGERRPEPAR